MDPEQGESFSNRLLAWYDDHGRHHLPWQQTTDPYRVWVSEIMLQQTQVEAVIPYFKAFMDAFPSVVDLAEADEDRVLSQWSGLGYYARARNLHKAARIIMDEYAGEFPSTIEETMALPGIGRSTAGAILAFTKDQRHPILDGNVKRVLCRVFAVEGYPGQTKVQSKLWELADQLTPTERVADYTQAIMDLGATLCTRRSPRCTRCPINGNCLAQSQDRCHDFPFPKPKKARPVKHCRMLVIKDQRNRILLTKRPPSGIWGGLWCFPQLDDPEQPIGDFCLTNLGMNIEEIHNDSAIKHGFTHYELEITPIHCGHLGNQHAVMDDQKQCWFTLESIQSVGTPRIVQKILNQGA